ncbi:Uncharacterized protein GBIM_15228 [Gryllus bimaculatus]|nr:Uncharacterized protein GBIM_15228 [Gryllus bimaculatus]
MQWKHMNSPPSKKCRTVPSVGNGKSTVFWDTQSIILIDWLEFKAMINSAAYVAPLKRLHRAIQTMWNQFTSFAACIKGILGADAIRIESCAREVVLGLRKDPGCLTALRSLRLHDPVDLLPLLSPITFSRHVYNKILESENIQLQTLA